MNISVPTESNHRNKGVLYMKKCEKCGFTTENEEMVFCIKCGNKMTEINPQVEEENEDYIFCGKCGFKNPNNIKFCPKCGNSLENGKVDLSKNVLPIGEKTVKKKKHTGIIVACSAAAIIIASAIIIGIAIDNEVNGSEEKYVETTASVSAEAESEPLEETASETAVETTVNTSQTTAETTAQTTTETTTQTTAVTTAATEAKIPYREIAPSGSDTLTYSFTGGSISLKQDNRFFYFNYYEYYTSYYSYIPSVSINSNSEAAKKIESALKDALQLQFENGEDSDAVEIDYEPEYVFGNMTFKKEIISVAEEDGLLFVTIGNYEDYGGNSYMSRISSDQTYTFDTSTGDNYILADLVKDKTAFTNAIDDYIVDLVYDNTYNTSETNEYSLKYDDFAAFEQEVKENLWFKNNTDWSYDGNKLIIRYYELLGYSALDFVTVFDIPKSVWEEYVDFSSKKSVHSYIINKTSNER